MIFMTIKKKIFKAYFIPLGLEMSKQASGKELTNRSNIEVIVCKSDLDMFCNHISSEIDKFPLKQMNFRSK